MNLKTLFSLLTVGLIVSAYGQKSTMELTFTAMDNGLHVPLDSIFIENITQGGDTILYAPESTFIIDYLSGINENGAFDDSKFSVKQNYPNPFMGKTEFDLYLPEKENIIVTVQDILSREMVYYENILNQGNHSFVFYAGLESYYILTVIGEQSRQTIKMLNAGSITAIDEKCKLVYIGNKENVIGIKSQESINNFVFNLGDELQYTGYALSVSGIAISGSAVIVDKPKNNTNYEFVIIRGDRCPGVSTITDIDGNVYNTVQIGHQCWMAENLKTTTYNNGTAIPNVTDSDKWSNLSSGSYAWYNNDISWKDPYGALYNWYAVVDTNGLCPTGWHVPTVDEWNELINFIGGAGSPHGRELRSCRQENSMLDGGCLTHVHPKWRFTELLWGTDKYGFSGLPGGARNSQGVFDLLTFHGSWFASTEDTSNKVWDLTLQYNNSTVSLVLWNNKQAGFSVRCLRD